MKNKKKKQKRSIESILSIIGWSIILLGWTSLFIDVYLIKIMPTKHIISIFLFIQGIGWLLLFPKAFDDYENDEYSSSVTAKMLLSSPTLGLLFILAAIFF